jgi:hypothetical protein
MIYDLKKRKLIKGGNDMVELLVVVILVIVIWQLTR